MFENTIKVNSNCSILKDSHIQLQSLFQIFIQGVVRTMPPKVFSMGAHLKMNVLQNNH